MLTISQPRADSHCRAIPRVFAARGNPTIVPFQFSFFTRSQTTAAPPDSEAQHQQTHPRTEPTVATVIPAPTHRSTLASIPANTLSSPIDRTVPQAERREERNTASSKLHPPARQLPPSLTHKSEATLPAAPPSPQWARSPTYWFLYTIPRCYEVKAERTEQENQIAARRAVARGLGVGPSPRPRRCGR